MSSVSLDTQNAAASGPVTSSVLRQRRRLERQSPMPGLMPPPITCEDAAEVEPIEPRLDAG